MEQHPGGGQTEHSSEAISGVEYLSPEQLEGHPGDVRSDVYAFGTLLYEIFTGQAPYQGSTAAEIRQLHLMQDPAPPGALAEDLPPALDQLIARAMARAAGGRYGSVGELLGELESLGA